MTTIAAHYAPDLVDFHFRDSPPDSSFADHMAAVPVQSLAAAIQGLWLADRTDHDELGSEDMSQRAQLERQIAWLDTLTDTFGEFDHVKLWRECCQAVLRGELPDLLRPRPARRVLRLVE